MIDIGFISGFAVISDDADWSRRFFADVLGLPLEGDEGYLSSNAIGGAKHFGVWPLQMAAMSCFGSSEWPESFARPQATLEFEVETPDAVSDAATELITQGYTLVHQARTEPWGQVVARLQTPEGLLIGISFAPWFHPD